MSIVTIEKEETQKRSIQKSIDQSAEALVYDILQKSQYVKPIDSTVRETVANGVDALKEKEIAELIISGKKQEEDYFIKRNGQQYKDSNFNRDYYDLKWFSPINEVVIHYIQGVGTGFCDKVEISDTGVGLSPERFRNLFNLGYSTKRNTNKGALGGYGLIASPAKQ